METNIFEPMIVGWSDKLVWDDDELKQAAKLLSAICKANGGEIAPDVELDTVAGNAFAIQQLEGALARRVAPYAKEMREKYVAPKFSNPLNDQIDPDLPDLIPHEWNDRINLNTDDVDSLCKLPGVGRDIAFRIIDYRQKVGSYSVIEQLIQVDGIGNENFAALKDQVYCGSTNQTDLPNQVLSAFMQKPTFQNYVEIIAHSTDPLALTIDLNKYRKTQVIAELEKTLEDVKKNPYGVAKNLHFTRASKILTENGRKARVRKINENAVRTINYGALLYDSSYFEFVGKLIEKTSQSIMVMMFFMKYEEETDYVTNSLVEGLIKARARGLDVKVILDKDAENGRTGSRLINESVFVVLKKNNVSVVFDREDRMTHSKLVIVDGRHVVVGSHNWTGGSYWAYDDTSIYIESEELAMKYHDIFIGFWNEYSSVERSGTP